MQHKNFYETIPEANMRLKGTIVLYEDDPFLVHCITNHKPDGIYRIYLEPIGKGQNGALYNSDNKLPVRIVGAEHPSLGDMTDAYMEVNPESGLVRKYMTASGFNKFRPFPLGMVNVGTRAYYTERTPLRSTPQGLTSNMVKEFPISIIPIHRGRQVDICGPEFRDTIQGRYPSFAECVKELQDPKVENLSVGFDRQFALVRGPIDMLFLAYKTDIVGCLSNGDATALRLGRDFAYALEVIDMLGIFETITVR